MLFLPRGARDEEPGQEGRAESGQPEPGQESRLKFSIRVRSINPCLDEQQITLLLREPAYQGSSLVF